ncbi:MAG: hypothetical protein AMXMBFR13_17460 [Phycisphaerae bacterium]
MAYIYGLALIAAWCSRYAANVKVTATHQWVADYLERTGFIDVVQRGQVIDSPRFDTHNCVALTQLLRQKSEEADLTARRLRELFVHHAGLNEEQGRSLGITFAELIENVYRHAENDYPGYVMAQAHPAKQRFHVVIVDPGIGIYDSFRRSDVPEVRSRAVTERDALRMATEAYVTSKASRHAGYGLYVVSTLAEKNRGVFRLTSGRTTLIQKPQLAILQKGRQSEYLVHPRWQGTSLGLMFNLDVSLPLREVYTTMTKDAEDFF